MEKNGKHDQSHEAHNGAACYRSFLLRLWSEPCQNQIPVWRFSLQDVASGERYGFADLESLLTFIRARTDEGV